MLGKLARIAVDTVTLPVAVAADVLTLGTAVVDRGDLYTTAKAKRIADDTVEVVTKLAE